MAMSETVVQSLDVDQFIERNAYFLDTYVEPSAASKFIERAPGLQLGVGAVSIAGFIKEEHSVDLNKFMGQHGGTMVLNPLIPDLIDAMSDMSRLYVDHNKLLTLRASAKRLGYSPENESYHTFIEPHHDWKDGNAVLYNWNVKGSQVYRLGDYTVPLEANQLTILNGDSTFLPSRNAYGTVVHAVESQAQATDPETALAARDRILVFWDGEATDVTMLPPEA